MSQAPPAERAQAGGHRTPARRPRQALRPGCAGLREALHAEWTKTRTVAKHRAGSCWPC